MKYWQYAIDMLKNIYGTEYHPHIATTYWSIGILNEKQGELAKGIEYLEKARDIFIAMLGKDHSNTISVNQSIQRIQEAMQ